MKRSPMLFALALCVIPQPTPSHEPVRMVLQNGLPAFSAGNTFAVRRVDWFDTQTKRPGDMWCQFLWARHARRGQSNPHGMGRFSRVASADAATMRALMVGQQRADLDCVVLDFEVQDGRPNGATLIRSVCRYVQTLGRYCILWTNPVGGGGWERNGLTGRGQTLYRIADAVSVMAWPGAWLLDRQAAEYSTTDWSRVYVIQAMTAGVGSVGRTIRWCEAVDCAGAAVWRANGTPAQIASSRLFDRWIGETP